MRQSKFSKLVLVFYSIFLTVLLLRSSEKPKRTYYLDLNATLSPQIETVVETIRNEPFEAENTEFTVNDNNYELPKNFPREFPLHENILKAIPELRIGNIDPIEKRILFGIVCTDEEKTILTLQELFAKVTSKYKPFMAVTVLVPSNKFNNPLSNTNTIESSFHSEIDNGILEVNT